jgi:hypothetical protein
MSVKVVMKQTIVDILSFKIQMFTSRLSLVKHFSLRQSHLLPNDSPFTSFSLRTNYVVLFEHSIEILGLEHLASLEFGELQIVVNVYLECSRRDECALHLVPYKPGTHAPAPLVGFYGVIEGWKRCS